MRLETLTLNDFQSYDNETVEFDTGISIIYGENGAGKSTLLRGIFAALFQTSMKSELTGDINIGGLVNKNETSGSVELTFTEDGQEFTVFWEIEVTEEENGERRGRTKSCTLTSSDGTLNLSGVTEVTDYITDLLGIDAQAFVNSVYVQQEELTKLLTADTDTRKQIFDRLLGLQRIDSYIDRIDEARREVKSVRKDKNTRKEELQNQLDTKSSIDELQTQKEKLEKQVQSIESDISDLREQRDELQTEKATVQSSDSNIDELEDEQETLNSKIEEKKDEIGTLNEEIQELEDEQERLEGQLDDSIEASLDELQERVQNLRDERNELQEDHSELTDEFTTARTELTTKATKLSTAVANLESARNTRENAQVELERLQTKHSHYDTKKKRLQDELSNVPFTLQTLSNVEDAIEWLTEQIEQAENDVETITSKIKSVNEDIATRKERLTQTYSKKREYESQLELPNVFQDCSKSLDEVKTELLQYNESTGDELTIDEAYELAVNVLPEQQASLFETEDGSKEEFEDIEDLRYAALYYVELYEQQELKNKIDDLQEEGAELGDAIVEYKERREELLTLQSVAEDTVSEFKSELNAANELKETLSELRELEEQIEDAIAELDEASKEVRESQEKQETLNSELNQLLEELQEKEQMSSDVQSEIDELNEEIESVQSKIQTVQTQNQVQTELDGVENKLDNKKELLETKTEQLTELKNDLESVEDEIESIDTDSRSLEEIEADISKVEDSIETKEEKKEEKQGALVRTENELETVQELTDKVDRVEDEVIALTEKLEQVKAIKQSYVSVKETTRKKYLSKINHYTNEIFQTIYENESYESVEIDSDYQITLHTSDGTQIEPSLTSGGESAIVNLALRAGVYRVITEAGNGSLPPFILDEPTTFLDSQHVGKLEALARKMADWDIEQVFIVSHNEQLIESGDAVYHVVKEANKSAVNREY